MRIDKTEMIAGLPVKAVRDFLRGLGGSTSVQGIAQCLKIRTDQAASLVDELERRSLLKRSENWANDRVIYYEEGPAAARFMMVRFLKPISRAKASKLVDDFLQRVETLNANDEFLYVVGQARVFGSFIDEEKNDLGDVDLAVRLDPRHNRSREELTDLSLKRAQESGKQFSNFLQELFYGEREVMVFLKARNRYLSIHPMSDLEKIGAKSRVIFGTEDRNTPKVSVV